MESGNINELYVQLAIAIVTFATTWIAVVLGKKASKKIKERPATMYAGYERLIKYIEDELRETKKKLKDADKKIEDLQTKVEELKTALSREKAKTSRMRRFLLDISRTHGVDVSSVVE